MGDVPWHEHSTRHGDTRVLSKERKIAWNRKFRGSEELRLVSRRARKSGERSKNDNPLKKLIRILKTLEKENLEFVFLTGFRRFLLRYIRFISLVVYRPGVYFIWGKGRESSGNMCWLRSGPVSSIVLHRGYSAKMPAGKVFHPRHSTEWRY